MKWTQSNHESLKVKRKAEDSPREGPGSPLLVGKMLRNAWPPGARDDPQLTANEKTVTLVLQPEELNSVNKSKT